MKIICTFLFGFTILYSQCLAESANTKDLKKNTVYGFVVPYVLRYDPKEWSCIQRNGGQEFDCSRRFLEIMVSANKEEKNLPQDELDRSFEEAIKERFSNKMYYESIDIKPSKMVTINGINFLHQSAMANLVPNSIQTIPTGGRGFTRRYISADGGQDQLDYYMYSGDNGRVSFYIEACGLISSEDQTVIDELLRGFSFDGSACRGPAKLRALKTIFEVVTNQ